MSQIIHNRNNINISENIIIREYEKSNIFIIENILDEKLCDDLKDVIDTINLKKTTIGNGNNVQCNFEDITQLLKSNDEMYYQFTTDQNKYMEILENIKLKKNIYTNKLNGLTVSSINEYNEKIETIFEKIKDIIKPINPFISFDPHSGFILRKIYGETQLHIDNISEVYDSTINFIKNNRKGNFFYIRSSSIIFTLNDDYDGGIFNFPYYDISLKLKKGSVIIFPPYWTHEHSVSSLENNTYRYTLSTWGCMKM